MLRGVALAVGIPFAVATTGAAVSTGCGLELSGTAGLLDGGGGGNPETDATAPEGGAVLPDGAPGIGWTAKRKLTVAGAGAPLTKFALLVMIDATRITYAKTKAAGADIRFTDATGNVLPHEIEKWSADGASFVWVAVPVLAATTTDIWMFYGNPAANDEQRPTELWDADYVGVWHLVDGHDSTAKNTSVNHGGTAALRVAAPAMHFNGVDQWVDTGSKEQLATWTIEAWIRAAAAPKSSSIPREPLSRGDNYQLQWDCASPQFCRTSNVHVGTYKYASFGPLGPALWHYIVATYDGTTLRNYVAGAATMPVQVGGPPSPDAESARIARGTLGEGRYFEGDIDEVRISRVARPAAYAVAHTKSMSGTLVTYGPETANPSLALAP